MRRFQRFRLKAMFALTAVCCLALGASVAYYRGVQQRWQVEAELRGLGAHLVHERRGWVQQVPSRVIDSLGGDPTIVPIKLFSPFANNDSFSDQTDEKLAFSRLADEHVTLIARCRWLERIELQGSKVTSAGLQTLKKRLPHATVLEPDAPQLNEFDLEMIALETQPVAERAVTKP